MSSFVQIAKQPSSHNCLTDNNGSLDKFRNTNVFDANGDKNLENGSMRLCEACILVLFGRVALGPFFRLKILFKIPRCSFFNGRMQQNHFSLE